MYKSQVTSGVHHQLNHVGSADAFLVPHLYGPPDNVLEEAGHLVGDDLHPEELHELGESSGQEELDGEQSLEVGCFPAQDVELIVRLVE